MKRAHPEADLQRAVVAYLAANFRPGGPVFFTSINPVPSKSRAVAGMSRALGMRAGVPDLCLIREGLAYWIELKAPKGHLSAAQADCRYDLERAGCGMRIAICTSVEAVEDALTYWGFTLRARIGRAAA